MFSFVVDSVIDERDPILDIINIVIDNEIEERSYKREFISYLFKLCERRMFFGRKSITISALQNEFYSSPYNG